MHTSELAFSGCHGLGRRATAIIDCWVKAVLVDARILNWVSSRHDFLVVDVDGLSILVTGQAGQEETLGSTVKSFVRLQVAACFSLTSEAVVQGARPSVAERCWIIVEL